MGCTNYSNIIKFSDNCQLFIVVCYNIVGMFVRFHPISRVKLLFGVAFLFSLIFLSIQNML
ncbi:hypothetical protein EFO16_00785 [Lactococcus lactis]|nr:hypothetical protein [Lactococcus lactis]RHJ30482.1 hypothetical protein DW134_00220 [Lactococcus lactis]